MPLVGDLATAIWIVSSRRPLLLTPTQLELGGPEFRCRFNRPARHVVHITDLRRLPLRQGFRS